MLSTPSGVATKYGDGKTDKDASITPSQVPEKKLVVEVSIVAPVANEFPWPAIFSVLENCSEPPQVCE